MKSGLLIDKDKALTRFTSFQAQTNITVPPYIDHRYDMLPASDQGETPKCAAYAMAGIVEYYRWRVTGIAQQVDPDPIYAYAKQIDGEPNSDGTTLECVVQAAIALDLMPINPKSIRVVKSPFDVQRAIHRYGPILSGYSINQGWFNVPANGWITDSGPQLGGHAVVTCGYANDETPQYTEIQNSWGDKDGVGWRGYMRMTPQQFSSAFQYGVVWDLIY